MAVCKTHNVKAWLATKAEPEFRLNRKQDKRY